MQHWVETFDYQPIYSEFNHFTEDTIIYDIETTGLSSKRHQIYLIGCMVRIQNSITLHQFFAETPSDEPQIIRQFFDLAKDYSTQMTFNGVRFDEPFLRERAKHFHIDDVPLPSTHFDILKKCHSLKKLLCLTSCRQKTIENFLGIQRIDSYSGGELIPIYQSFIQHPSSESLMLLKQHNYDDVQGMLALLPILQYFDLFYTDFHHISVRINDYNSYAGKLQRELEFSGKMSRTFPATFRLSSLYGYFIFQKDIVRGTIPLHHDTLKYYVPNYKDYVFLPNEKTILLKELADYIPKDQKKNASPDDCFMEKEDDYIQIPANTPLPENFHIFKEHRKDKNGFLSLRELDILDNEKNAQKFLNAFLQPLLSEYKKDG